MGRIKDSIWKSLRRIKKQFLLNSYGRLIENTRKKTGFCIVFIATPGHGNLGDHAIVYGQKKFFRNLGYADSIIEIASYDYLKYAAEFEKLLSKNDLIIIDGGGSMGNLWIHEEDKMQEIVKRFPENPIIIFPQTIYYSEDEDGQNRLLKSIDVYSHRDNLIICAREKASYKFMKENYVGTKVLLIPDIVLYVEDIICNVNRNGVAFCLREDKEKNRDDNAIQKIKDCVKDLGLEIKYVSTVIPEHVHMKSRDQKLKDLWEKFYSSQLVVTDRLHGMIFAAITGTPCLAFDNSSHKVFNSYKWIEKLPYVILAEDAEKIDNQVIELINLQNHKMNYEDYSIREFYFDLENTVKVILNNNKSGDAK